MTTSHKSCSQNASVRGTRTAGVPEGGHPLASVNHTRLTKKQQLKKLIALVSLQRETKRKGGKSNELNIAYMFNNKCQLKKYYIIQTDLFTKE